MRGRPLQILLLEDVAEDAELITEELRRGNIEFQARQVQTADEFLVELKQCPPDLVLSDHGSPGFDGFTILSMVRNRDPDLPFIFVTGALGERMAIKAFENGADDCILKHDLSHLVGAIKRVVNRSTERARLRQVEAECRRLTQELELARSQFNALSGVLHTCASCKKIKDENGLWTPLEAFFSKHMSVDFSHGFCPDCVQKYFSGI